jgi:hypothetical protein
MLLGIAENELSSLKTVVELGLGSWEFRVNCQHCTLEHTKAHLKTESRVEDALFAEETLHTRSGRAQASRPWPKACAAIAPAMAPVCGRCFGFLVVSWWSRWWSRGCDTGDHLRGTYVRLGRARTSFGLTRLP